jgi:hypothetical protein
MSEIVITSDNESCSAWEEQLIIFRPKRGKLVTNIGFTKKSKISFWNWVRGRGRGGGGQGITDEKNKDLLWLLPTKMHNGMLIMQYFVKPKSYKQRKHNQHNKQYNIRVVCESDTQINKKINVGTFTISESDNCNDNNHDDDNYLYAGISGLENVIIKIYIETVMIMA